jgi:hypothetical protein
MTNALESRRSRLGDLLILLHGARAHADGAHDLAPQEYAAGEDDYAAPVRVAELEERLIGLRLRGQIFRLHLEGDGGVRLVDRYADAPDNCAVHPDGWP